MSSTEKEKEMRRRSPFANEDADEGALEIDEGEVERSVSLDPHLSPVSMLQKVKEWSASRVI